jgi:3-oxoadipate enol-lactonase
MKHDIWDRLSGLTIPVGIFGGKYDGIAPLENQKNRQQANFGSILGMFEGAHIFHLQDRNAWQRVIKFLKDE